MLFTAQAAGRLFIPEGAILALEDVTEQSYRVDRMLTALLQSGALEGVAGVVLGDFTDCSAGIHGVPVEAVLAERLRTQVCVDETLRDARAARQIAELGGPLVWNVKVHRVGGLSEVCRIVRIARGSTAVANMTGMESLFLVVGVVFAVLTPVILAVLHVRKNIWENSVKSVALADRLRGPVLSGLCGYGFASMLVRVVESVALRRAVGVAWPVWDLILVAIGATAAAGAYALQKSQTRKP